MKQRGIVGSPNEISTYKVQAHAMNQKGIMGLPNEIKIKYGLTK